MDYNEKSLLVRRITCGKLYGCLWFQEEPYNVVFTDPSLSLMSEADWIYKQKYDYIRTYTNIPTMDEYYQILKEEGKWNEKLENEMKEIQIDIDNLNSKLNSLRFNKSEARAVKATISKGEKRLEELFMTKNQYRPFCAEALADRTRKRFIISNIAKIDKRTEVVNTFAFKDSLIVYYFEESGISESKLRELARSDPWRLYWTTSKDTGTPLFPHSAVEMTDLQYALVLWTKLYDFAFNSLNRPPDDVIADDARFDAWYKAECDRIDADTRKNQIEQNGPAFGNAEVFIPADAEGAKEVYALNDKAVMSKIKSRERVIFQRGEVKEQALPDVSANLQMEMNRMAAEATKNRSR